MQYTKRLIPLVLAMLLAMSLFLLPSCKQPEPPELEVKNLIWPVSVPLPTAEQFVSALPDGCSVRLAEGYSISTLGTYSVPLILTDAEGNEIGTTRAVYAALRVMQYVYDHKSIDNMTVAEAEKWLRMEQASPEYRQTIRNENMEELEYLPDRIRSYETPYPRARFVTITDGRHHAVMLLYLDGDTSSTSDDNPPLLPSHKIFFTDSFEFGWDNKEDKRRSHPYLSDELYQFNNFSFL